MVCKIIIMVAVVVSPILTQYLKRIVRPEWLVPLLNPFLTTVLSVIPVWIEGSCEVLQAGQWGAGLGALVSLVWKAYHDRQSK